MKKNPKVTIVIPVYNGSKYMKEAINSALAQTYKNIEIIVINDGSNDNEKTASIAHSYGNKIKYYEKENGGVSTALNLAISKMEGDYFSWLSHDDVYYKDKIEKQINYIMENDYYGKDVILYSDYDLIDKKSRLICSSIKNHQLLVDKPEYALLRGNINGITLLIPKKAFDDFGLFDEKLRCVQDYEMWRHMINKYKFIHMPMILAKSRQHSAQTTAVSPKVLIEGNKLWIDIANGISKENMERLEGSVYNHYYQMTKLLAETPYTEAMKYCENKCTELEKEISKDIDKVKVTVVMPFYNRLNLLLNSIRSVINQTHKNIEILLINDGSTDNLNKLKEFIKKDKRLKLINVDSNSGASNARNIGIEKATGQYIAFLDSDDLYKKEKIEKQLYQMILLNASISHTSYLRRGIGEDTIVDSGKLSGVVIPRIIYNCTIATPTVMIKKEILIKYNYRFNTKIHIGEDTCFWLELLRHNSILGIDAALTIVNVSESSSAYDPQKQIIGLKNILTYILNDVDYKQYDYEIAMLCNLYMNSVKQLQKKNNLLYSNSVENKDSKLQKFMFPLQLITKVINSVKKYGLNMTFKKIIRKIFK